MPSTRTEGGGVSAGIRKVLTAGRVLNGSGTYRVDSAYVLSSVPPSLAGGRGDERLQRLEVLARPNYRNLRFGLVHIRRSDSCGCGNRYIQRRLSLDAK